MSNVQTTIARLARIYRPARTLSEPLQLILWENIGYLIDDEHRAALLSEFKERVGLTGSEIAHAPRSVLLDIAKRGGMNAETRVERWRTIARIAREEAGDDLRATLKALPLPKARLLIKKFPAIGEPGADKVLLFAGRDVRPALESNGLRALLRLGLSTEQHSYAASYHAAVATLRAEGEQTRNWYMSAYSALRAHGQALCKRSSPLCVACPLDATCAHARLSGSY
jgi:endonuclease-3